MNTIAFKKRVLRLVVGVLYIDQLALKVGCPYPIFFMKLTMKMRRRRSYPNWRQILMTNPSNLKFPDLKMGI